MAPVAAELRGPAVLSGSPASSGVGRVAAWVLYDLANTFFAVAMLTFYFPVWVVETRGAREFVYGLTVALSMACVAVVMPFCGALSDATGQRVRYLRWTTVGCVAATALIGMTDHLVPALFLFAVANLFYQLGTVFYDALLWYVAGPGRLGQTSGVGAAFGYLGSMAGLLLLWPFARQGGYQAAFVPSAALFLVFALPAFLLLRDPPRGGRVAWGQMMRATSQRLKATVQEARASAGLWRYCWAWFCSMSAINTILFFMGVYTKHVAGWTLDEVVRFFLVCQAVTVLGSLVFSRLIGRWGSKRTLTWIWWGWLLAVGMLAARLSPQWLWVVGPAMGFCLGSTFATARVLLVELAPKERLGEFFGLAGLFARASAVLGPLIWGGLVGGPDGYRPGLLALMGLLGAGLWLLRTVPAPGARTA